MLKKIEKNINKKKIDRRIFIILILAVFILGGIFALEMVTKLKTQKQQVENTYNKSLYEAVFYINNLEAELAKVQIMNTSNITITSLANIWKQANMAKENFENLPTNPVLLQDTCKYLTQVSDYSYSLMKETLNNKKIEEKQYEQIATLHERCESLNGIMNQLFNDLNDGKIKWEELEKASNEKLEETHFAQNVSNFEGINKTFQDYEGLIYDGAFSDHLLTASPKFLSENEVSQKEAKEYVEKLFERENIEWIKGKGESTGRITLYQFDMKLKEQEMVYHIYITKNDCKLYLMIADRAVIKENISMKEAKNLAKQFLEKMGINNVMDTYYLKEENMAIINFAGVQENVTLYSDLIKVKVALDDGQICSVEAQGYVFNHCKREDLKPSITIEAAKAKLNQEIQVLSESLAMIPTDSGKEILAYEFKGKIKEKEFLVYVNAKTGNEERILIIYNTPNGTLTM